MDTSDEDAVSVHDSAFEGEVEFDVDASTNELVDKLDEIKDDG